MNEYIQYSVYIIVLNYNNYSETINCVNSLKKISYPNATIVIIENCSTNNSKGVLKKEFPDLNIISSEKNNGYSSGMNIGIRFALKNRADFIMVMNNDMLVEENFLEPLVNLISSDDKIGVVSPKVLYMHDRNHIYCAGGEFNIFRCAAVNMYQNMNANDYANEIREITSAEGSCLLVRKEVFQTVGLFDEKYFMYFEDLDFSDKVRTKFKILFQPLAITFHKAGAGQSWANFTDLYYYYFTRNRLLYFSKHKFFIKIYVLIYSLINISAKSTILLTKYFYRKISFADFRKKVFAMWKGFFAGSCTVFRFNKLVKT